MLGQLIHRWRMTRGLHWEARRPTIGEAHEEAVGVWQMAIVLAIMGIGYGIVGRLDYEEGLRQEAERHATRANLNQAALLACLNGRATGHYWVDASGNRHYLACRGVDEIPVGRAG